MSDAEDRPTEKQCAKVLEAIETDAFKIRHLLEMLRSKKDSEWEDQAALTEGIEALIARICWRARRVHPEPDYMGDPDIYMMPEGWRETGGEP